MNGDSIPTRKFVRFRARVGRSVNRVSAINEEVKMWINNRCHWGLIAFAAICFSRVADRLPAQDATTAQSMAQSMEGKCTQGMLLATQYLRSNVAVKGGYVYKVTLDLKQRWGEGTATPTEVWVQPPGTPAVGMAFVKAYNATGQTAFLDAATECAEALLFGQLESGCWTDRVDFDPNGKNAGPYRHGNGNRKGRNYSTLDDDKSQSALRLLIAVDKAHRFRNERIHEAVLFGLNALLRAQFANGGFPQGWQKPVDSFPVVKASFPDYDWRTEGRFKNYWDFETLNDGLAGTVVKTLQLAYETYEDQRYRDAMLKFGDFLILAQLPEPQPAWAQQYNHQLQPIWARKFEPPSVVGVESIDVIETLLMLADVTKDQKYLAPIPGAIEWLKRSLLPDGQLARFYEMRTNRPLYFTKDTYELTYDDSNLPTHYGFKSRPNIAKLEALYQNRLAGRSSNGKSYSLSSLQGDAEKVLSQLDAMGRWVTSTNGQSITKTDGIDSGELFIESSVFIKNMNTLTVYLEAVKKP